LEAFLSFGALASLLACSGAEPDEDSNPKAAYGRTTIEEHALADVLAAPQTLDVPKGALGFAVYLGGASFNVAGFALPDAPRTVENDLLVREQSPDDFKPVKTIDWSAPATAGLTMDALWTVPSGGADPSAHVDGPWQLDVVPIDGLEATAPDGAFFVRSGTFSRGVVDVNVFMAEGVASADDLTKRLNAVFGDFAGLELGEVMFFPLPTSATMVDSDEEAAALRLSTAAAERTPSVDIIVVDGFAKEYGLGNGDQVRGESPVPGLGMRHGVQRNGVFYRLSEDVAYDALVLRHELGHFAGLYHTTEIFVSSADALDDTPECSESAPADCPDYTNLMFPVIHDATPRSITAKQAQIIRSSTLYRDLGKDAPQSAPTALRTAPSGAGLAYFGSHWANALPASVTRRITGICGAAAHAALPTQADRALLLAVANDVLVSSALRRAALEALPIEDRSANEREQLVALATDPESSRDVRLGAIAALFGDDLDAAQRAALGHSSTAAPAAVHRAIARFH
jgi:hypothetical protein